MRRLVAVALMLSSAPAVWASNADFDFSCTGVLNCQQQFRGIVEDTSAAINYKALGPAEATGLLGFGIGAFANYTETENPQAWKALTGSDVDQIGMVGIVAHKGLPLGIDVGAFYTTIPGADVDVFGAEVRYAILEGGVASPALAVRGSYTATKGIDDLKYRAYGADVSLSKGLTLVTPYAGAGYVWATATPEGSLANSLDEEDVSNARFFVGARITLLILELTPEYERVGDNNAFNLRLGFSF